MVPKCLCWRWNCPALAWSRLSNLLGFALGSFCSLQAFCTALEDESENGGLPISPWRSQELGAPLPSEPPEKSSQSLPSPWSLATLRAHLACDRAFLSLAPDPGWSLQAQQIPVVRSRAKLLPGVEGESPRICHLLGPCWKCSGLTVLRITVYGNPELRAR